MKVALVTGAASGIGEACARRLAQAGMAVAGLDVQPVAPRDGLDIWQGDLVDLRRPDQVEAYVEAVRTRLGPISILVNAAGVLGPGAPTHQTAIADYDRVVEVNLRGPFLVSKSVLPSMLQLGGGAIVNIASIGGLEGAPTQVAYGATKAGLIEATRTMAMEYGPYGIRVNCVCPGLIRTPMTEGIFSNEQRLKQMIGYSPLRRWGGPEDVAGAVNFLVSDDAAFITGQHLVVDGGWTAGRQVAPEPDIAS